MEDAAPYGHRNQALLIKLVKKLTEATKQHKILWYHDSLIEYRIRCDEQSPLDKLAICFYIRNETDEAVTIYIDQQPMTYTSEDLEVWKSLKDLEWAISEDMKSTEALLTSMFRELENLQSNIEK